MSVPFSEVGSISIYDVLGIILSFWLLGALILTYLKLCKNVVDHQSMTLICRDSYAMLLSALWKVAFIVSFSIKNFNLYLINRSWQHFWAYVTSNFLLSSSLLISCYLENINFFEKEINHDYPSIKRIVALKEAISSRQKGQFDNHKKF